MFNLTTRGFAPIRLLQVASGWSESHKKCALAAPGDEVVKERATRLASVRPPPKGEGIEVHEDELGQITAQPMYRMRCECGRPWFELELKRLVQCPACHKLNLVSV
jgi:hypothetical protein